MNVRAKIEPLLLQAQKPAQYIGGEVGSICKELESVDVRFAFCFPDTYEIGMSHLGMKTSGVNGFLHPVQTLKH